MKKEAEKQGAKIYDLELDSQFRCSGSGNYIGWLESIFNEDHPDLTIEVYYFVHPKEVTTTLRHRFNYVPQEERKEVYVGYRRDRLIKYIENVEEE